VLKKKKKMPNIVWDNESAVNDAIASLRKDGAGVDWVIFTYPKDSKDHIELLGSGSDGFNGMIQHVNEDNCYYCLLRVNEKIDESATIKFVYIKYLGQNVKPMQKGRINVQTGEITKKLQPYHVSYETSTLSEVTEQLVIKLVGEASMSKSNVIDKKK